MSPPDQVAKTKAGEPLKARSILHTGVRAQKGNARRPLAETAAARVYILFLTLH